MGVDLAFHSPLHYYFNGEYVHKGWADILVIGDTRCGKGQVTESLSRYYGVGAMISGENSSFVGIIGGTPQVSDRTFVSWGLLVLNNGRLVCIDELSELPLQDLSRMSRVRSEGIAEVSKGGYHHKTQACTRLISLSNPRERSFLKDYSNGAEATMELFGGKREDVARLTYAIAVAQGEVQTETINKKRSKLGEPTYMDQRLDRQRILFTWSRNARQIVFSKEATDLILKETRRLSTVFSPQVPLFQSENGRFKLATIAASFAATVMSVDKQFRLRVNSEHVECAVKMLYCFYSKECMAYVQYSISMFEQESLKDESSLSAMLASMGANQLGFVSGILDLPKITYTSIAAHATTDKVLAREMADQLVGLRALRQEQSYFTKTPAFTRYLRRRKAELQIAQKAEKPKK